MTNDRKYGIIMSVRKTIQISSGSMKENTYYLFCNEKKIAHSYSLERLLNKTIGLKDGKIYYNNVLVWVQNPNNKREDI